MISISDGERRRRLARRHLLAPATGVESVPQIAEAVVALHSTDPVTVFLSIAARSSGLKVADVERALYEEQSVIRHHAMRRTLWVTTPTTGELAHAACTRKIAERERTRNAAFVGDAEWFEDAVRQVTACVASADEPLTTRTIGEVLPALRREIVFGAGTRHEATGGAHSRAVLQAAFDGKLIRTRPAGTWIGSQYAWTDPARWTSIDWSAHTPHEGMVGLVNTWLRRFGPGTLDDLVWWTGATKTAVRAALEELDAMAVDLSTGAGVVLADDIDHDDGAGLEPWAAVLPALDPTAMGWKSRAWYLDEATRQRVVDRFGNIGPTVWVDGEIVGGWAQRPDGTIAIEMTRDVPADRRALIDDSVERVREFVGDARYRLRFPPPNQPDLID